MSPHGGRGVGQSAVENVSAARRKLKSSGTKGKGWDKGKDGEAQQNGGEANAATAKPCFLASRPKARSKRREDSGTKTRQAERAGDGNQGEAAFDAAAAKLCFEKRRSGAYR